jgi:hypothetical protein
MVVTVGEEEGKVAVAFSRVSEKSCWRANEKT